MDGTRLAWPKQNSHSPSSTPAQLLNQGSPTFEINQSQNRAMQEHVNTNLPRPAGRKCQKWESDWLLVTKTSLWGNKPTSLRASDVLNIKPKTRTALKCLERRTPMCPPHESMNINAAIVRNYKKYCQVEQFESQSCDKTVYHLACMNNVHK